MIWMGNDRGVLKDISPVASGARTGETNDETA